METQAAAQAAPGTYLAFRVGGESYGLGILRVQEVIGLADITRVPQMTESVRGVINLRGRIIPVFDLRVAFGVEVEDTEITCVVIGQVEYGEREVTVGFIADEIRGVIEITEEQMGSVPEFGRSRRATFLTGMATTDSGVIMFLDIDRIMDDEDVSAIADAG
jgi:purine-binding chemotaxis protein CheW